MEHRSPSARSGTEEAVGKSRVDRLVTLVDHCTSAKDIAEAMGDTFLVYMLSMSIMAARVEMRPKELRLRR